MPPRQVVRYARSIGPADVGRRVSVRRRLDEGGMSDAVGILQSWADGELRVRRKDGTVVAIAEHALVAGKVVPPGPPRVTGRSPTHAAVAVADLERVAALGWRATETAWLGGWLLRAAAGWTGRANSVLPLGEVGLPPADAVAAAAAWYADRGLVPRFQVPLPVSSDLDDVLAGLGWTAPDGVGGILVMTADVDGVLPTARSTAPAGADLPAVRLSSVPGAGWLDTYRYRGGPLPAGALAVLLNADAPVFAEVVDGDGATLAVGRASVDGDWVGITAMDTAPAARRRGLGGHILRALVAHGRDAGARHVYLQVSGTNAPAIGLYASLGLAVHHTYHYRTPA